MNITIRNAQEKDFPQIIALIKELAVFEKAEDQVTNSVEQMRAEKDFFKCFVAEISETKEIVGMALYYFAYYTWVGKSLYLDDLYVKQTYRGYKVGTQLLQRLFEVAKAEKCNRVRWQVLDWNKPAVKLYTKMGANLDSGWYNCDFDIRAIQEIIF